VVAWFGLFFTPLVTASALFVVSIDNFPVRIWLLVCAARKPQPSDDCARKSVDHRGV
jgi:hypothetical protein